MIKYIDIVVNLLVNPRVPVIDFVLEDHNKGDLKKCSLQVFGFPEIIRMDAGRRGFQRGAWFIMTHQQEEYGLVDYSRPSQNPLGKLCC